jgi:hypothetical protein
LRETISVGIGLDPKIVFTKTVRSIRVPVEILALTIRAHDRSQRVFTPSDFLDLGNRPAVDQAISRLLSNQTIRRIGHGLYDFPRMSMILNRPAPPDIDQAVQAFGFAVSERIAKRDKVI